MIVVKPSFRKAIEMSEVSIRRALISVFDKKDIVPFAKGLVALGVELLYDRYVPS
mgnify:CR=1 FL=1